MKVVWLGHSCFKIEKDGYSVILDPYEDGSVPGLKPVRERANMVICSHEHGDHNARACVAIEEAECPFKITTIDTYHDDAKGTLRGTDSITILADDECRVAHVGDLGCELEPEQLEQLKGIDVLLVPVGGFFTIDGAQAAKLMNQIKPVMTIPMHYRSDGPDDPQFGFPMIGEVKDFLELCDNIVTLNTSEVDAKAAPAPVVVLQPLNMI